jgi:hypothetical protein
MIIKNFTYFYPAIMKRISTLFAALTLLTISHAQIESADFKPYGRHRLSPYYHRWLEIQGGLESLIELSDMDFNDEIPEGNISRRWNLGINGSLMYKVGCYEKVQQLGAGVRFQYIPTNQWMVGLAVDVYPLGIGNRNELGFVFPVLTSYEIGIKKQISENKKGLYVNIFAFSVYYRKIEFRTGVHFDLENSGIGLILRACYTLKTPSK